MGLAEIKTLGALALVIGVAVFGYWDMQKPRAAEDASGSGLYEFLSGSQERQAGPRTGYRSKEELERYQYDHLETFKAKVGASDGEWTLAEVAYYAEGASMTPPGESKGVRCPSSGYYYVSRSHRTLGCGKSYDQYRYELCGTSDSWDKE